MSKRILVTGGAGFIGSALLHHLIGETDATVLCLDKLTYAGRRESIEPLLASGRLTLRQADICDAAAVAAASAAAATGNDPGIDTRTGTRSGMGTSTGTTTSPQFTHTTPQSPTRHPVPT